VILPRLVFIEPDGARKEVEAPSGLSILEIAHRNGIDIEGACEGSMACSTCHDRGVRRPDRHAAGRDSQPLLGITVGRA
jgi:uncharacterized 2Fe-2S/4Fe-4S cluster protein (DUF4445 family)